MSTFVLIHGSADVGASWRQVERELRKMGHDTIAPDLPCDDNSAGLQEYADTVVRAIGHRKNLIVVGHSYGGFTAPLVAERCAADAIVLVAAMVPAPGEAPKDYWKNTRHARAVKKQAALDGGLTGHSDLLVQYYHDVPRKLAERAMRSERGESTTAYESTWPLSRWPATLTKFVLGTEDRLFPADYLRRVVSERLGIVPDEIAAGHYVILSRPKPLARLLDSYADEARRAAAVARGTKPERTSLANRAKPKPG